MLRAFVLACLLVAVPLSSASSQFGFSLYRSGVDISGEDLVLLREAVRDVLQRGTVGASESWSNQQSGMSGMATLTEVYEDFGTQCVRVDIIVRARQREAPFDLRLCQRPDGTWGVAG